MAADAHVNSEKHRFDAVRIDRGALRRDPQVILEAVAELGRRRGELGDLVIVACEAGKGPSFFDRIMKALEKLGNGRQTIG